MQYTGGGAERSVRLFATMEHAMETRGARGRQAEGTGGRPTGTRDTQWDT